MSRPTSPDVELVLMDERVQDFLLWGASRRPGEWLDPERIHAEATQRRVAATFPEVARAWADVCEATATALPPNCGPYLPEVVGLWLAALDTESARA